MTKLLVSLALILIGLVIACERRQVLDGSSEERFWLSIRDVRARLTREEVVEFEFAIVRLRKRGYTEDELARLSQPPLDRRFLSTVDGKTAQEIIKLAKLVPKEAPSAPAKQ